MARRLDPKLDPLVIFSGPEETRREIGRHCCVDCAVPDSRDVLMFGYGGRCPIIAHAVKGLPRNELRHDGLHLHCTARVAVVKPTRKNTQEEGLW